MSAGDEPGIVGDPRAVPGSIAEVRRSPSDAAVGAFFDVDGTLVAGFTAMVMVRDRLRRRDVSLGEVVRNLRTGLDMGLGRAGFNEMMAVTVEGWRGRPHAEMEALGDRLFAAEVCDLIYAEARLLVAAHQEQGHTVVLASSASRYQVGPIARELGVDHVLCTEVEIEDELLTGKVAGDALWGAGKSAAVQAFAAEHGIDLARSYFYADGNEDVVLMHVVGKPRPTNPGRKLEQVARRRGWPVLHLSKPG